MSPAPSLPPDLHYADSEPVQLDVTAIIARGLRLRRRRRLAKVALVAAVCAITPAVIVTDMAAPAPVVHSDAGSLAPGYGGVSEGVPVAKPTAEHALRADFGPELEPVNAPAGRTIAGPQSTSSRAELNMDEAVAGQRPAATVPPRFGRVLAIAGARPSSGAWFAAASARLTLFHVSDSRKLRSWPLPVPSSARARSGVSMAVSNGGVVWIGVSATLIRFDPRSCVVSSWRVPAPRSNRLADRGARSGHQPAAAVYSVAVSPDGNVAVAMSQSSSVQLLDPRSGRFSQQSLPSATDQPLAVGYTRTGILGIGFRNLARAHSAAIMLVGRSGERLTAKVTQSSAVTAYGKSGLLVGTSRPVVVSSTGQAAPLVLPTDPQNFAQDTTPPVPLPGDRLGIAAEDGIVTFPAAATSVASAASESELWLAPAPRCAQGGDCRGGYRLISTDAAGDLWAVPNADPRAVVLLSLR